MEAALTEKLEAGEIDPSFVITIQHPLKTHPMYERFRDQGLNPVNRGGHSRTPRFPPSRIYSVFVAA